MADLNVGNLEFILNQKITSATTAADLQLATKALEKVRTGMVYQVETVTELPSASASAGQLWFVRNAETLYWSTGVAWVSITSTSYGEVWVWGQGVGTLPSGSALYSCSFCSPVRENCSAINWCAIAIGGSHGGAVKADGSLWAWGSNACGGRGDGANATNRECSIREFCSATNWCNITANFRTTSAIKTDGSIWNWGNGVGGMLGDGTAVSKCSPVREICSAINWCFVHAGNCHRLAIKTDGSLWGWGYNTGVSSSGRLGDGTATDRCSPVREFCSATNWCNAAAGQFHSIGIKTDGTLWTWGGHTGGATAQNLATGTVCSPVREVSLSTTWCLAAASHCHSAAVKTDGSIWTWGKGVGGTGGRGNVSDVCSPVREASSSTTWCRVSLANYGGAAVKTDGTLWTWGCATYGRLADGTTAAKCSPVREICSATNWSNVCINGSQAVALKFKTL